MAKLYEVIVGNIGTVFVGESEGNARSIFLDYVGMSKDGYGRASCEPMTLMCDDQIF